MTPHTRAYRKGELEAEGFPLAEISDHLAHGDEMVWADVCRPTAEQLDALAAELGLHELAIEDALEEHQRPKLDLYTDHLFLSCHAVAVDAETGQLRDSEVDVFVGDRWMITVRRDDEFSVDRLLGRWDRSPDLAQHGVGFLLYGVLDEVVDDYFSAVDVFDRYYDEVSDAIFGSGSIDLLHDRRWFEMRRALGRFHRHVVPMREAISSLMRREHAAVAEALYPYYQDVYDHILRVGEESDVLRELATTIVETDLSLRDYRQNQNVKKVSSWAAVIAVPALITGYYGMNVRFPGLGTRWGAAVASVIIVVSSLLLYRTFKRNDWL